jgi:hypothetical protein
MLIQIRLESEKLVTFGAFIILVQRMCLHVGPQVTPIGKCLTAMSTSIGFLARMRAQVSLQQPRSRELFTANTARVSELDVERKEKQKLLKLFSTYSLCCKKLPYESVMRENWN